MSVLRALSDVWRQLFLGARLRIENPYRHDMEGSLDGLYFGSLRGWARARHGSMLAVIAKKNGTYVGECLANSPRADLAARGMGDGRYGFSLSVPREFGVEPGDIIEVIDASKPARRMALRITRRAAARPAWRRAVRKADASFDMCDSPTLAAHSPTTGSTGYAELAVRFERLASENRQLRALTAQYEAELKLNLLQLRQVQEELESWFLKYLEVVQAKSVSSNGISAAEGQDPEALQEYSGKGCP